MLVPAPRESCGGIYYSTVGGSLQKNASIIPVASSQFAALFFRVLDASRTGSQCSLGGINSSSLEGDGCRLIRHHVLQQISQCYTESIPPLRVGLYFVVHTRRVSSADSVETVDTVDSVDTVDTTVVLL